MSNLQNLPRTNRRLGTEIRILDARTDDWIDFEGEPFATMCETHGAICLHDSRTTANRFRTVPEEWCEDCRKIADAFNSAATWEGVARTREEKREAARLAGLTGWATTKLIRLSWDDAVYKLNNVSGYVIATMGREELSVTTNWLICPQKGSKHDKVLNIGSRD